MGDAGVSESVATLMARTLRSRPHSQPTATGWTRADGPRANGFFPALTWLGPRLVEANSIPPDPSGAAGPAQVFVAVNGFLKLFDKDGALLGISIDDDSFFESVRNGDGVRHPQVRFDRLSGRWFVTEITTPASNASNRILIAVSSGPTLTVETSFTFYQFQHDLAGTTPNADTGLFADHPSLGIDRNALYIGADLFTPGGVFSGSTGYVVRKSSLLAGTLVVTPFRGLAGASTAGPLTPQGVDNDDPAADEGYFVGVDHLSLGALVVRRVTSPGSTPAISPNLNVTVPTTADPLPQVANGSVQPLDGVDRRLSAATITKNRLTGAVSLWTAHAVAVDASGIAGAGDRNGVRWYEIDHLTTAPALNQSGTIVDPSASNFGGYWIPAITVSGQGHAAAAMSAASASLAPSVVVYSRQAGDASGTMPTVWAAQLGVAGYNVENEGVQQWGSSSRVAVDPADDQTLWAFQEYSDADNSWSVRVIKLTAPLPATPASASSTVPSGAPSAAVTITGASSSGSGFFDPGPDTGGPGFANHISATVGGGVTVNSVTFTDATHIVLNVSTLGAAPGVKDVTVTNPDGQSVTGAAVLTVGSAATTLMAAPSSLAFAATKNGAGGALVDVTPPQTVTVAYSGTTPDWAATADQPWLQVTGGAGFGAGSFTVGIVNPGNVIGGQTSLNGTVTLSAPDASPVGIPVALSVQQTPSASGAAFGRVDAPAQNATGLQGAIGLTGWALDDIGVTDVKVYRNCLPFDAPAGCQMVLGHSVVFVGNAGFVPGARPDVESAFPTYPQAYRAGWGLQVLSNMLPHVPTQQAHGGQGAITFYAVATDEEGHQTLLGRSSPDHTPTSVTLDNDAIAKPFGSLDTPAPGATVSGTFANFGWALTPDADTTAGPGDVLIPLNGSTVTLFIDGLSQGTVAFNQCRGNVGNPVPSGVYCNDDVANIFGNLTPQPPLTPRVSNPTRYRNLDAARGAIGAFVVDTTALSNGAHTIGWSVTDSSGRADGIGSRFFAVLNGAGGIAAVGASRAEDLRRAPAMSHGRLASLDRLPAITGTLLARTGFDLNAAYLPLAIGKADAYSVALDEMGRLEMLLGPVDEGYLVVKSELRDLPIGARLDIGTGSFTWNPPVGFFGTYRLVFISGRQKRTVDVMVGPAGRHP